ncbi:MAG TPA: frataxin family protein [Bryobacteraceae bacterium]|nr:frataxin family protein [Bryobacteraceae bacterium]
MRDDAEFKHHADNAIHSVYLALTAASDDYAYDVSYESGVLTVEIKRPRGRLVVDAHPAARQIRIFSPSRSYKLDWDVVENEFLLSGTGENLKEAMEEALSRHLKEDVAL